MLKIYAIALNRADFVGYQADSFAKNLKEDHEFTFFSNVSHSVLGCDSGGISLEARKRGIRCVNVESDPELEDRCQKDEVEFRLKTPVRMGWDWTANNISAAYGLCWAWKHVISKETCPVLILHADMFLVKPTVLTDWLRDVQVCFPPQGTRYVHMWDGGVLLDMAALPEPETLNWYCGQIDGFPVDVGGQTHHYLQAHPDLKIRHTSEILVEDDPALEFHPSSIGTLYDGAILHYRSGSNWNQRTVTYHEDKTIWLCQQLGVDPPEVE